jgi:hypothetical protein
MPKGGTMALLEMKRSIFFKLQNVVGESGFTSKIFIILFPNYLRVKNDSSDHIPDSLQKLKSAQTKSVGC